MTKPTASPPGPDEIPESPGVPDPAEYVPLSKAMAALHRLYDDPEFRKTPAAIEVAYALGAVEEDVWGGIGDSVRAQARKHEALDRVLQLAPALLEVIQQWVKLIHPDPIGIPYDVPPYSAGPLHEAFEKEGCQPITATPGGLGGLGGDGGNVARGWGCCVCAKQGVGPATYNGDQRMICGMCGHVRCGKAAAPPVGGAA